MQRWVSFRIHFRIFSWVWNSKILKKLSKIIFQNSKFFLSIEIGIFKNFKIHIVSSKGATLNMKNYFRYSKTQFPHFHSAAISLKSGWCGLTVHFLLFNSYVFSRRFVVTWHKNLLYVYLEFSCLGWTPKMLLDTIMAV